MTSWDAEGQRSLYRDPSPDAEDERLAAAAHFTERQKQVLFRLRVPLYAYAYAYAYVYLMRLINLSCLNARRAALIAHLQVHSSRLREENSRDSETEHCWKL